MREKLIAENTYLLSDFDMCCMYLLLGDKSAMLIDTGLGFKGLSDRISKLVGNRKLIVALTHGHVDHIGGAGQFKEVYIHDSDLELEPKMKKSERIKFITENFFMNPLLLLHIKDVYKIEKEKKANFKSLKDGHTFDLGGRKVTFTHTPGHTKGSGCFFDSKTKILFSGDMVSPYAMIMFPESAPMSTYNESLNKIKKLSKKADAMYGGHSFITPAKNSTLKALIKMTDRIIEKNSQIAEGTSFTFKFIPFTSLIFDRSKIK